MNTPIKWEHWSSIGICDRQAEHLGLIIYMQDRSKFKSSQPFIFLKVHALRKHWIFFPENISNQTLLLYIKTLLYLAQNQLKILQKRWKLRHLLGSNSPSILREFTIISLHLPRTESLVTFGGGNVTTLLSWGVVGADDDFVLCAGELLRLDLSLFGVFLSPLVSSLFPPDFSVSWKKCTLRHTVASTGYM